MRIRPIKNILFAKDITKVIDIVREHLDMYFVHNIEVRYDLTIMYNENSGNCHYLVKFEIL